jgi:hypothetical protein
MVIFPLLLFRNVAWRPISDDVAQHLKEIANP